MDLFRHQGAFSKSAVHGMVENLQGRRPILHFCSGLRPIRALVKQRQEKDIAAFFCLAINGTIFTD
jgi:hypothetical protein